MLVWLGRRTVPSCQYTLLSGRPVQTGQVLFEFKFTTGIEWYSCQTRDIICRLCNKDRDQGSKGIWGLGIDPMVAFSTSNNCVFRQLCACSVRRSGCKQSVYSVFSTISINSPDKHCNYNI